MSVTAETIQPPAPPGLLAWLRQNLFNSWFSSIITILSATLVLFAVVGIIQWVFFTADWRPVTTSPILYLVGQYPRSELWRPGLSMLMITFLLGMSWGVWGIFIREFAIFIGIILMVMGVFPLDTPTVTLAIRGTLLVGALLIFIGYLIGRTKVVRSTYVFLLWVIAGIVIVFVLLSGIKGAELLPQVTTTAWGGLLVTLLLAVGAIVLSFPIGVLLALGRRSSLPVLKGFSILFIETVRGVPLITILFMFSIILALFLPAESRIDRLMRALIGMTVFSAAYTAENVRGGLQAIPHGQVEAAPAIVGQFIALFKDTTLVIIVGLNELLGIGKSIINSDPEFIRLQAEVYLFIAVVFWIFSYFMSYASRQLESALGVGER
jgi:general L-amino acid transport system permease protein